MKLLWPLVLMLVSRCTLMSQIDCRSPDIVSSFNYADLVFEGESLTEEPLTDNPMDRNKYGEKVVTFRVDKIWKGVRRERVQIAPTLGMSTNFVGFQLQKKYLVYARRVPYGTYESSPRSRLRGLRSRFPDLYDLAGQCNFEFHLLTSDEARRHIATLRRLLANQRKREQQ